MESMASISVSTRLSTGSIIWLQMHTWIDQHLRHGLGNFKIESFQSAYALRQLHSQIDCGLGDDTWIEDLQGHIDLDPVCLADSESRRINSEMNTGDWRWDTEDQLPARATIVPVICASNKTHLTNLSGDQHGWPLYLTIGNIHKDICSTPEKHSCILVGLISCPPKGAKSTDEAWHSVVGTVLTPLRNLDITGPSLKWECADDYQRQCYALLAAWVGDYPEHFMIAPVSYGSCPMCEIPKAVPPGIQLVEHSMTPEISMLTQSWGTKLPLMFCKLFVFIQSATSSGNSLSAMAISFGSLMNCISCSWG